MTSYDYVFFDEAGQAEEPLTLIPAVSLLKRTMEGTLDGNFIFSGSPKQLGPITHLWKSYQRLPHPTTLIEILIFTFLNLKTSEIYYGHSHCVNFICMYVSVIHRKLAIYVKL